MRLKTDIVVIGGGPAGVGAAVAAARHGAEVILVEKEGYCGGMGTSGGVPAFSPYSNGKDIIVKGIALEVRERLVEKCPELATDYEKWQPIDPEFLKQVYDEILTEAGVKLLLHAQMTGVKKEGKSLREVLIQTQHQVVNIEAEYFIDCTGNAELVALAGGNLNFGDEDNRVQALTLCFRLGNVDTKRYLNYLEETGHDGNLTSAVNEAKKQDDFNIQEIKVAGAINQQKGVVGMNFGHEYEVNPLDPFELSQAEVRARGKLDVLINFMKKYVPGFEEARLIGSGPSIGVRETRRIIGHYQLTEDDYYKRSVPYDVVAISNYPIDLHSATFNEKEEVENKEYYNSRYSKGEYYGIPYRSLIPTGFKNVGVAGRTISADRKIHGSCRLMNTCIMTGQAVGTAAALLVGTSSDLIQVSMKKLQEVLVTDNMYIPTSNELMGGFYVQS